jgi:hypothetical protein
MARAKSRLIASPRPVDLRAIRAAPAGPDALVLGDALTGIGDTQPNDVAEASLNSRSERSTVFDGSPED